MAEAPQWLTSLVDTTGNCTEAHCAYGPLAFRWRRENGFWEVVVYLTLGEIVGGAQDGAIVAPGFSLDVQELISTFQEVSAVRWQSQSLGPHDNLGPHVSIEGVYHGHEVWLQVLAEAPDDDEQPGFKVDLLHPRGKE